MSVCAAFRQLGLLEFFFFFLNVDEHNSDQILTHDHCRGFALVFASYSLSLSSCYCFVLICIHNGAVSSSSALPGLRWPSSNLPWRKGHVCRYWAQIWPSAVILVRQTEPSRGSARLLHQVSITLTQSAHCIRSGDQVWIAVTYCSNSVSTGMP